MTKEELHKANRLQKDIEHLELKRQQIFDFDKILKERKLKESEQNLFLNSMIDIVDAMLNIKKEQFEKL
jgi:Tfp pilus assembly protein PilN